VLDEASARSERRDAVLPGSGGPAGNRELTAWLGLVLLALFLVEIVTTFHVEGMLTWHVAVGAILLPYALAKTASTSWRIARYYAGNPPYRHAGPPPVLLRLLGPLVVMATLGLLATGVLLIAVGPATGRQTLVTVLGQRLSDLSLHQGFFVVFCVVTGAHLLARVVPALSIAAAGIGREVRGADPVPGRGWRMAMAVVALGAGVVAAVFLVRAESAWHDPSHFPHLPGQLDLH
jgi:hypothetical protein